MKKQTNLISPFQKKVALYGQLTKPRKYSWQKNNYSYHDTGYRKHQDGTGRDIWRSAKAVLEAAIEKAYKGDRKIEWFEVYAGEKALNKFNDWLPEDTLTAMRDYVVSIKGPLTTPVGGGMRSLNVALRQLLDLYVCLRPVRWFRGVPSPVKHPEKVDMVIFRENC